jgi:iron complex transport system permease protein
MKKNEKNLSLEPKLLDEIALEEYKSFNSRKVLFMIFVSIAIVILGIVSIIIGPLDITVKEVFQVFAYKMFPSYAVPPTELIMSSVWFVRLPRLLTAFVAGFSLAIVGAVMQPVLRNPMASPFTLGISSGAGFGAAMAIILGKSFAGGSYFVVASAFVFALMTSFIIIVISKIKGSTPEMMILTGIALSYLFSAGTTFLEYFADSWAVNEVVFWMVGSLSKGTWDTLHFIFPVFIVFIPYLIIKAWDLNSISAGDDVAKSLGVNVDRMRITLMVVASLVTASIICFTGAIGFIGLVAPHITRMVIGGDNRFVVPASGLVGAFLLMGSDIVAMNILAPVILPIGIMTSVMGAPIFIYLIIKMKRGNV